MNLSGERRIPAPRQQVWTALHDVQVLQRCIPGCDRLETTGNHELSVSVAMDPVPSRLVARVTESAVDVPNGCVLHIEGTDGAAEPVSGTVLLSLHDEGPFTLVQYGARGPHEAAARIDAFFDRFTSEVASPAEVAASGPAGVIAAATASSLGTATPSPLAAMLGAIPAQPYGLPLVFWLGSAVFAAIFVLIFSAYL